MYPHTRPVVPRELIQALAAQAPVKASPASTARFSASGQNASATGPASESGYTSRLLVEKWLTESGIGYRVKLEPDALGRTVYVLQECPFNPDHRDPDACIMQSPDGMMAFQCFHSSCKAAGCGWQECKAVIGKPKASHYDPPLSQKSKKKPSKTGRLGSTTLASAATPSSAKAFPDIQTTDRQLRDLTDSALAAILTRNNPPSVFVRGRVLTRVIERQDDEPPRAESLAHDALRGVLARVANWFSARQTQHGEVIEQVPPPSAVVGDLSSLPAWSGIPRLRRIVESPVFLQDGTLVESPGYCLPGQLWYSPSPGIAIPPVPLAPTSEELRQARELLVRDLLGDFPFQDQSSRAHAIAALILPFVRSMIDGPTPLHLFDAPTEGTGKSLLAAVITHVGTGRELEAIPEAADDSEWRKRLTAALDESPTFLLLDNLNRTLDSGALAVALTSGIWKDRILGVSKMASYSITAVWLASGNNTRLSRELIRRTIFCRLDAKVADPHLRAGFRHPHLRRWAAEHRGELIAAVLTLVRGWIAAGRPAGTECLGMFEAWTEVVGGILAVAGISGLLENAKSFRASRSDRLAEWEEFVRAWQAEHKGTQVGVKELFKLVQANALLDSVIGDKGERSQRTRLGQALVKAQDRVIAGFRIVSSGEEHSGCQQFELQPVPSASTPEIKEWQA